MKRICVLTYAYVLTSLYVILLLLLHAIGAVVGFIGVAFTIASHVIMLKPKSVKKLWEVYILSVKYF